MDKTERKGSRKDRNLRTKRIPELGYYLVVTDTEETEANYLYGFRDSIPKALQDKLVVRVSRAPTRELIEKCLELLSIEPQYRIPWIVLDRDQVKDFDKIISDAEKQGISVGWSNPCIEIWLHAYFGAMPVSQTSVKCVDNFKTAFQTRVNQKYEKSVKDIYQKLCSFGNETNAIRIAERRFSEQKSEHNKPSEMLATSSLYMLIKEIRDKTER